MGAPASTAAQVVIEIGRDARLIRLVRLAARSLATDSGFRADDLDDLALALDELVAASLAAMGDETTLRLAMDADDMGVTVRGTFAGEAGAIEVDDVARSILDNAADRWTVGGEAKGEAATAFHLVRLGPEVG